MNRSSTRGARWTLAALAAIALVGCNDDSGPTLAQGGSANGPIGSDSGGAGADDCDCGDSSVAKVPLPCACAAGLCTELADDLVNYQRGFGRPSYVLLGTCEGGYHSLSFGDSNDRLGQRVYDAEGHMVFDYFDVGAGADVTAACGLNPIRPLTFSSVSIGLNPGKACTYCLFAGDDPLIGDAASTPGAGPAGVTPPVPMRHYPASNNPPCDPAAL